MRFVPSLREVRLGKGWSFSSKYFFLAAIFFSASFFKSSLAFFMIKSLSLRFFSGVKPKRFFFSAFSRASWRLRSRSAFLRDFFSSSVNGLSCFSYFKRPIIIIILYLFTHFPPTRIHNISNALKLNQLKFHYLLINI